MDKPDDPLRDELAALDVPPPAGNAVYRILEEARRTPRRQIRWLGPLRQLRAAVFVPRTRVAIMAGVFVLFTLIGLAGRLLAPDTPPRLTAEMIPDELLLYDVEFAEDHDLPPDFWEG